MSSPSWLETVNDGSSATIGSCEMYAMPVPRTDERTFLDAAFRSTPSNTTLPRTTAPAPRLPSTADAVTVLPQPDSPTMPSDFPGSTSKLTRRTTSRPPNDTERSRTDSTASGFSARDSATRSSAVDPRCPGPFVAVLERFAEVESRSASATSTNDMITSVISRPLGTMSHGCWESDCCASDTMPPQLGAGGITPRLM